MSDDTPHIWVAPKVTLISRPQFIMPEHLPIERMSDSHGELLIEFAGRLCYMSQKNPGKKFTHEYINNILKQQHFSVTEHANYSFLIEGISRSLTHEFVRHRHLSPSQLSQRYVDESDVGFVVPPRILDSQAVGYTRLFDAFLANCRYHVEQYRGRAALLEEEMLADPAFAALPKTDQRKAVREAARGVLPNETETKMVVTGNLRAWRHFLTLRGNPHADREIRRLSVTLYSILKGEAPAVFQDFALHTDDAGVSYLNTTYHEA